MKIENLKDEWKKKQTVSVEVDGNKIELYVGLELKVNNELQDIIFEGRGINDELHGKLPDGRKIRVKVGGLILSHYCIFVDDKFICSDVHSEDK